MHLSMGEVIANRYEIVEKLGSGGMAIVYRAIDKKLNRSVTFKVMREEFINDEDFIKRFEVEARAAASISHPNLVNVYDVGNEDMVHYIVMEYIDGLTLKDLINRKAPFSNEETLGVAVQIASALEHAHKNNIIHRDIKPQNILVTKDGTVKVTDFGIARAVSETTIAAGDDSMGSVHYFSPEQARGGFVDFKSDIYSLGIVMYEMITGELPFDGETPVAIALMHINEPLPNIKEKNSEASESLIGIIHKAAEKLSGKRFANITDMLNSMKRVLTRMENFEDDDDEGSYGNGPDQRILKTIRFSEEDVSAVKREARNAFFEDEDYDADYEYDEDYDYEDNEYGDDTYKQPKKKKNGFNQFTEKQIILAAVATSFIIISIICVVGFQIYRKSLPVQLQTPDLLGKTVDEAQQEVESMNLTVIRAGEAASDEIEAGLILEQSPIEGGTIYEGDNINVIVSLGSDKEEVPSVINKTLEDAYKILTENFMVRDVYEYRDDTPMHAVFDQDPQPGEMLARGDYVTIYISQGKEAVTVTVPAVEGLSESEAKLRIQEKGLTVDLTSYAYHDTVQEGYVISQTVRAGSDTKEGNSVGLVVSRGPDPGNQQAEQTETPPTSTTQAPVEGETSRTIRLMYNYIPDGLETVPIRVLKYTLEDEVEVVLQTEVNIGDFPLNVTVSGKGTADIFFYVYYDGEYKLQGRTPVNFSEGGN